MRLAALIVLAAAFVATTSAPAAVTVIGNSQARSCYEAARVPARSRGMIAVCDEALQVQALSRDDEVATYVNRGVLRATHGDVAGAVDDYDAAIALDPTEPEAWLNKGFAYLRRSDPAGALRFFDAAVANSTTEPALAYYGRGIAHEQAGNVRAAYADFVQARDLNPRWALPRDELRRFKIERAAR